MINSSSLDNCATVWSAVSSILRYGLDTRELLKRPSPKRPPSWHIYNKARSHACVVVSLAVVATNRQELLFLGKGPKEKGTRRDVNFMRGRPSYPQYAHLRYPLGIR